MDRLKNRIAIVTGAASGIGEASAKLFAAEGARVVVSDINVPGSSRVVDEIKSAGGDAVAIRADIGQLEDIRALIESTVEHFGALDILFNNAAALNLDSLDLNVVDINPDTWNEILRVNVTGVMLGCKYAIPYMLQQARGSIINTSSMAHRMGMDVRTAYCASKAAINALTRSVATQYGKRGIRCNSLAPGLTLSPSVLKVIPAPERQIFLDHVMSPTLAEPQALACAALFLASDDAAYVNGTVLEVDGGTGSFVPLVPSLRNAAAQ